MTQNIEEVLARLESRLEAIDQKLDAVNTAKHKSFEWIGQLSEQIRSLDAFREEVRASFEPLMAKLESMDEVVRIMRHATSDVARRVETLEQTPTGGNRTAV